MAHILRGSTPPSREPVRVGRLERTLDSFNAEIGQKVARVLKEYDRLEIVPVRESILLMEKRLQWLELPWYRRLWISAYHWLSASQGRPQAPVAEGTPPA